MRFSTYDAEWSRAEVLAKMATPREERANDNLVVSGGLTALASALNWAVIQNQNVAWGSPYSLFNLGDAWGAVGTSNAAPAGTQTGLNAEIGRAIISNGAVSVNQLVFDFFFGVTSGNGSISEAGMFAQGGLVQPTLTSALASGTPYTSLAVTAVVLPPSGAAGPSVITTIPTGSTLIIGYGTGTTQVVTTTAPITNGNTSISVASFNANANYAGGQIVAYAYGTMIDRSTFITPVVKTNIQTALLEVTITLISG